MMLRPLLIASIWLTAPVAADRPAHERYLIKVPSTPDIGQLHHTLPEGGSQHCASAAVSNSLVWLARNGYPKLFDATSSQLELSRLLGSARYFKTDPRIGTNTVELLAGLQRYVTERGYRATLQFQGWWLVQDRYRHREALQVDLDWLTAGVEGKSGVWLNIGWYRPASGASSVYQRIGGHWVTLVGYDTRRSERVLVIHDPAQRSPQGRHEVVRLQRLARGRLAGAFLGLPVPAAGVYRLSGELQVDGEQGPCIALLDGAVRLRMR